MINNKIKLTDGNIIIRPCQPEDAAVICEGVRETMQEMLKWAPWCHPDYAISDCKSWLDSRHQMWSEGIEYDFVVFDTKDDTFLGGCAVDQINRKKALRQPLSDSSAGLDSKLWVSRALR